MKLIHCADLHLDSPMEANLSGERARERARELRDNLSRLWKYADGEGVRAILIAGDLFDSENVRGSTVRFFLDTVRAYPSIATFYLTGNHDGGVSLGEETPKNLYLFGRGWRSYRLGEVTVTGSTHADVRSLSLDPARCNLILLHGQERPGAGACNGDEVHLSALRGRGADYVALGHLHKYAARALDERCTVAYSGCLEGRGFDECGECGFVLLDVEGRRVGRTFVPFARRRLHTVELDVSECEGHRATEAAAERATDKIPHGDLVKLVLTGERDCTRLTDLAGLRERLSQLFFSCKVTDETRVRVRAEDFAHDATLRGAFVRRMLAADVDEETRKEVIECGLRALSGEELGV